MSAGELLASVLVLGGVALVLLAAVGVVRFPDAFARMHAATKAATLGSALVVAAAVARDRGTGDTVELVLAILFLFVTSPAAGHMVARAAYRAGTELSPATSVDELATAPEPAGGTDEPAGGLAG